MSDPLDFVFVAAAAIVTVSAALWAGALLAAVFGWRRPLEGISGRTALVWEGLTEGLPRRPSLAQMNQLLLFIVLVGVILAALGILS